MSEVDIWQYAGIIVVFIIFSAFFSASETALTAVTRARIYKLAKEGNRRASRVSELKKEKEALIGSILIGNNLVNIAASALATSLSIQLFGDEGEGLLIVTVVMTLLVVIFAEILPKTYALQNSERVALGVVTPLSVIVTLLNPLSRFLQKLIRVSLRLIGIDISASNSLLSAADIVRGTIELHHKEGLMYKQEKDMLGSILDLEEIEVEDIMIHRKQVDALDVDMPAEQFVEQALTLAHSRIPLWQGDSDNIVGVLHIKDLIRLIQDPATPITPATLLEYAQEPWFIPETTRLRDQLLAFRARRHHFALVVDEYGAYQGIVTLEDIIEEIVGEIDDEHDEEQAGFIQRAGHNKYFVAGDVTIRDLNRELDWSLPDEHASTIAGLMMHVAEEIPPKGRHHDVGGYRLTVVDKTPTQIKRLKIEKLPRPQSEGSS